MQQLKKKTEGFTIIEVMIVLVIAAVIILIVFLAVPALQRNSRNTQRRNDVGRVLASLTEYTANNNGNFPVPGEATETSWKNSIGALAFYKNASDINFGGKGNNIYPNNSTITATTSTSTMWVRIGQKCNNGVLTATGASDRNFAAMYAVETGGATPQLVCVES